MSFMGADTDELRSVGQKCQEGKETVDQVIAFLKALIALLKAASFFSGGASAAYATYLETVVVPWMQKISAALGLFANVLNQNAEAQDKVSAGESVNLAALPKYTPQVSASSAAPVQPYTGGSVLGSPTNATAALGAIAAIANQALGQEGSALQGTGAPSTGTPSAGTTSAGAIAPITGSVSPAPTTTSAMTPSTLGASGIDHTATSGVGQAASITGGTGTPTGAGAAAPIGGGASGGSGAGSLGGGSLDSGSQMTPGLHSAAPVVATEGLGGGGTPGGAALTEAGGPLAQTTTPVTGAGSDGAATSYGTAAGIAGGAAAMGVGGAALAAAKGGTGADAAIDKLAGTHGRGSSGTEVRELQQRLTDAGYDTKGVDGQWGGNTERAYQDYRAAHPLPIVQGSGFSSPSGFDYNQVTGVRGNPNVTPEFLRGVEGVAQRVGAQPEHLLATMSFETGGSFAADKVNKVSGATGLIQFMPDTAKDYGTTTADLAQMTPTQQLPYVEQYLERFRGRVGDVPSLYSAVLGGHPMPADQVMFDQGTVEYRQNAGLDADGNGQITVREAADKIDRRLAGRS
jgi:hypothetical protein